jgi:small subunit ribosomal protein S8
MNNQIIKFLSLLKNSSLSKKMVVTVEYNSLIIKCVEILYNEGLLLSYSIQQPKDNGSVKIKIKLRNVDDVVLTSKIKIVSKPTNIKYLQYHQLCSVVLKEKTGFLSTNKGILTLDECKKQRLGGVFSFYS